MSDRIPKPNTAIYLLRDVPRDDLSAAHTALRAAGEDRTLKDALLGVIAKLAEVGRREDRRQARVVSATLRRAARALGRPRRRLDLPASLKSV